MVHGGDKLFSVCSLSEVQTKTLDALRTKPHIQHETAGAGYNRMDDQISDKLSKQINQLTLIYKVDLNSKSSNQERGHVKRD